MTDADIATIQAAAKELRDYSAGIRAYKALQCFDTKQPQTWQQGWIDACADNDPRNIIA